MKKRTKVLKAELSKNREKVEALPGMFALKSGRLVTYSEATRDGNTVIRLSEVHQPGELWQGLSGAEYDVNGNIVGFSFGRFSGYSNEDAQRAQEYTQNCAELLSPEFSAKVVADYNSKKDEFGLLSRQYDEICDALSKAEQTA